MNENNNVALTIENVHISYKTVKPISIKQIFKKKNIEERKSRKKYEAVKGVSFEVNKGEIVGIIGKNGSGKSTLLRAVANIYSPDEGYIDTHGNTVGLAAIGVGFVNELSGRENIYLSGMLMGFTKAQIDERMEDIIQFAGIGKFIDEPVRTYSSGMHSKLAFSITANIETDIMLIDETLSVGDDKFKKKSKDKMKSLIMDENKTVLIVSHSQSVIKELCQKVVWLDDGLVRMAGETEEVLAAYEEYNSNSDEI